MSSRVSALWLGGGGAWLCGLHVMLCTETSDLQQFCFVEKRLHCQ